MMQRLFLSVVLSSIGCGSPQVTDVDIESVVETLAEPELDLIYDTTVVVTYELDIEPQVWEEMLADPLSDEYREATFRWGDEVYGPVGVRFKGNSSRWMVQREGGTRYSLKIKFGEYIDGLTFHGIKKLNLHNGFHDPAFMRERLSYDAFRDSDVPASRVAYANVYLNGERHGLFISVEQVNKAFLVERFGDDSGNLYKPELGELIYRGDTIDRYPAPEDYELKTNEDEADHSGLFHFLDVLNNAPEEELESALDEVLEVETFLRWLAANSLLLALDSYQGSIAHNYYLYDNPSTGKFVYIPWDLNGSFGVFSCGMTWDARIRLPLQTPHCTQPMHGPADSNAAVERPLISRVLSVPAFRARYQELLDELVADRFSESRLDADIDRWAALISEHVAADPTKLSTYDQFLADLDQGSDHALGLRAFTSRRNEYIRAALAGDIEVVCGDGVCDPGETCEQDCAIGECPPCFVAHDDRCLPSCADDCTCPTDAPVELTCDPTGLCRPEAPPECNCAADQVCAPNGQCVPRCAADSDCPAFAPLCEAASGLCHS